MIIYALCVFGSHQRVATSMTFSQSGFARQPKPCHSAQNGWLSNTCIAAWGVLLQIYDGSFDQNPRCRKSNKSQAWVASDQHASQDMVVQGFCAAKDSQLPTPLPTLSSGAWQSHLNFLQLQNLETAVSCQNWAAQELPWNIKRIAKKRHLKQVWAVYSTVGSWSHFQSKDCSKSANPYQTIIQCPLYTSYSHYLLLISRKHFGTHGLESSVKAAKALPPQVSCHQVHRPPVHQRQRLPTPPWFGRVRWVQKDGPKNCRK